jgi:hypothetical protein
LSTAIKDKITNAITESRLTEKLSDYMLISNMPALRLDNNLSPTAVFPGSYVNSVFTLFPIDVGSNYVTAVLRPPSALNDGWAVVIDIADTAKYTLDHSASTLYVDTALAEHLLKSDISMAPTTSSTALYPCTYEQIPSSSLKLFPIDVGSNNLTITKIDTTNDKRISIDLSSSVKTILTNAVQSSTITNKLLDYDSTNLWNTLNKRLIIQTRLTNDVTGVSNDGMIRLVPTLDGEEACISFHAKASSTNILDSWTMGQNAWNVGPGNFGIGCEKIGRVLALNGTSGTIATPYNIFVNNSKVVTESALPSYTNQLLTYDATNNWNTLNKRLIIQAGASNNGMLRIIPSADGLESSLAFFDKASATNTTGAWWIGANTSGVSGIFGIGRQGFGPVLTLNGTTGAISTLYNISINNSQVQTESSLANKLLTYDSTNDWNSLSKRLVLKSSNNQASLKIVPTTDNGESSIYFQQKADATVGTGAWVVGQGSYGVGAGNFSFAKDGIGLVLSLNGTTGTISTPYNMFINSSQVATMATLAPYVKQTITSPPYNSFRDQLHKNFNFRVKFNH